MSRGNSMIRRQQQQPPTALVVKDRRSLTMCRLKNLLVITWGMLIPICPTLLYTLQLTSNHNQKQTDDTASSWMASTPSAGPVAIDSVIYSARVSWQDYLKHSVEQSIEGNEVELKMVGDRYKETVSYFRRWIDYHNREQDEQLRRKCMNENKLCTYWAAVGECRVNPTWMEEHCILACQRCDKLIDEEF